MPTRRAVLAACLWAAVASPSFAADPLWLAGTRQDEIGRAHV